MRKLTRSQTNTPNYNQYRGLIAGPLPPPTGGARILFDHLKVYVTKSDRMNWKVIPLSYSRNIFINSTIKVKELCKILFHIPRVDILSLHANPTMIAGYIPFILVACKLFNTKIQIRLFGANFDTLHREKYTYRKLLNLLEHADSILLETKGLVDYWKANYPTNKSVTWFPNSRNVMDKGHPKTHKIACDEIKFIYTGHVRTEKGITYLLKAFEKITHNFPSVTLSIIGRCDDLSLKRLLEKANNVHYLGEVPQSETVNLMSTHDCFVYPSFWAGEGYPGVIIEAMSVGLPILCTDWRFQSELVIDDVNGKLFTPQSVDSLALAMEEIIECSSSIPRLSSNSLNIAQKFDTEYWNGQVFEETVMAALSS